MSSKDLLWQESFKVRAYEVGPDGRAKIQTMFNYLQESAANHAAYLNVFTERLTQLKLTWVLSRAHLKIERYPFWRQKVKVLTWPVLKETYYAIRDFRILSEEGQEIGVATSSWMMIDVVARKPVAMPDFLDEIQNRDEKRAMVDAFDRLPKLQDAHEDKRFKVRLSDLDMNRHVNSEIYLDWALEAVPEDILKNHVLYDFEINYRAESHYGDIINSQSEVQDEGDSRRILHKIIRHSDERELTRLVSRWRPK